jgi:hypothetical protein
VSRHREIRPGVGDLGWQNGAGEIVSRDPRKMSSQPSSSVYTPQELGMTPDGRHMQSVVPALCAVLGARLTPEERQVVRALTPQMLAYEHHPISRWVYDGIDFETTFPDDDAAMRQLAVPVDAAAVLTSAIAIRVPAEPMTAVADELQDHLGYLPRLPFPVTLFELYDEDGDHNAFNIIEHETGRMSEAVAIVVAETEPGSSWAVWIYLAVYDPDPTDSEIFGQPGELGAMEGFSIYPYLAAADGNGVSVAPGGDIGDKWLIGRVAACCQLATARGATQHPVAHVSRQVRRAAERRLGWRIPKMYHLTIGGSAEPEAREGHRLYTCRWLVRGHWRRLPDGRRTWVRPFIKGPLSAPFKGRPDYTVVHPDS